MKAAIYKKYGGPYVVSVQKVGKPEPSDKEILIKISASTVNRTDTGIRSAEYFVSRFFYGIFRPKHQILGCEFAGNVEKIGIKVTQFSVGDEVFGFNENTFGGHAEYLKISQDAAVSIIPKNLSVVKSAAILEGAHYALNIIRAAKVRSGTEVLVYGATGAIGSAAVQLLKAKGAVVTAVCDTKNVQLVKDLGANAVVDYQKENLFDISTRFNFVFDTVGKINFSKSKALLKEDGIYISTEPGKNWENVFLAMKTFFLGKKRVLFPIPNIDQKTVIYLKDLVEQDLFSPVIDRYFYLDQLVDAHTYVDLGMKTGNVIILINGSTRSD